MPEANVTSNEIHGQAKTVRALLSGVKYSIDYYQREYKWEDEQIIELMSDLSGKFQEDHDGSHERRAVRGYGHYFLGSIIISRKNNANYLIDGQQRLTSLTLLLIYLRNMLKPQRGGNNLEPLIFSEQYGEKSFNLQIEERKACMNALYEDVEETFDPNGQPESVHNILARYEDIKANFPQELQGQALPYFADWLMDNVHLVEILAYSDDDAYAIFETMNDRGLSLSPVDMLKGYLLNKIDDETQRNAANEMWRTRVNELRRLRDVGKDLDAEFFKVWLRSQYAMKIRERKKGALPEDFDKIGTEFHRWVRDNADSLGLHDTQSYYEFITKKFEFYSRHYIRLIQASNTLVPGLEYVLYNAHHSFTLQYQLLLAPLKPGDPDEQVRLKMRLVAMYVDMMLGRRLWNSSSIDYRTMQYAMFNVMKDIRGLDAPQLAAVLRQKIEDMSETFASNPRFTLHKQNGRYMQRILARITDFVEQQSGMASRYLEYTTGTGRKKYEIEHIWADVHGRHVDEFPQIADFQEYRNRIGGLLLLPKSFNASYGALDYEKKLPHYNTQNLLARSLHPQCYDHNPGFKAFVERSGLPFKLHEQFKKADLDARQSLYTQIAEQLWRPERLAQELGR